MTHLVDLRKKPYNLDEEAISWVENTIAQMTLDEKIGHLFVNMGIQRTEEYLTGVLEDYKIAAVRYNPGPAADIWEQNYILQTKSKIPLLIAANTESGGNGAVTDGTKIGDEIKIAATADSRHAYEMGKVAGIEAAAVGCNASFAPIMDLSRNWRNPIIANRTWGADVDQVIELSKEYMRGIMEHGIVPFAKHFPGDGIDERDHHLSFASNPMTKSEWMETFGRIYGEMADAGLPGIMAGHIHLPNVEKEMHPERELDDMLPASLNKTLLDELLRGELGYNGAIVTDASHMIGMTASMPRRELLPTAIEAGCDLFLFFNDPEEDLQWMKEGLKNGLLTEERLHDALRRTLGLKAKLGLHLFEGRRQEIMLPKEEALALIGKDEAKNLAKEVADKAITLVKSKQEGIFPVNPDRYKRILLVEVDGYKGGFGAMINAGKKRAADTLKELLEARGHEVSIWGNTEARIAKLPEEERPAAIANVYASKRPIAEITDNYDLIINLVDVNSGGTTQRIIWPAAKGTPDQPFYVHEIPTIVVSVQHPFALADMPQVATYINAYDGLPVTLETLVTKLAGESSFTGVSPVDAYCGLVDTHIWRGN
ncbi:glycoside hydrolase family 3 N-terminal domain-containing protein [Streptococcus pneumoniae]|uniref:beta-N-acetylhexosaminidase n=1 Tax=Streptococcus pneumoniae TaxID=1313 RepID=A0A4J1YX88_STREE|nr:glycoside hydrolase family 3 N-terminal domain-containing protein [Streptococcus pneumoniae]MDS2229100.1 glycoside hydrolase family 3 N-terminal domain-containing protein [Streptococcus pneumoniae]MDS2389025.1 glycoside hydrolase family 3 N-terminal domain-containing protein [Streptococcus pneumoniae]MDS2396562.1 glycoside hydrolase family 3 N-terminal domain-containing protein [Streptococcus pneumoniae]MDS2433502.1 glycoside hydrolase family 3 N-terminal domain-containing protein [Streptoco